MTTEHERAVEAAKKAFFRNMDPGLGVEEAIAAYLSALAPQAGDNAEEPVAWQFVPKQATKEMEEAAVARVRPFHDMEGYDWNAKVPRDLFRLAWPAMLAAAPVVSQNAPDLEDKPCGIADPTTRDCPNMKEVGGGMDGERYRCAVCGKGYYLDYEEMK